MRIRPATDGDAEGIARVQEQTWQAAYRHVFPAAELDRGGFIRPERWRDRIVRPPAGWTTLVAERDGAIAGFASVGPSRDEPAVGERKSEVRWGVRAQEVRYRKSLTGT